MNTAKITNSTGHSSVAGQVKRVVRLNIGLNNNPYDAVDIVSLLNFLKVEVDRADVVDGEYNGDCEPTLVVTALTHHHPILFDAIVESMTEDMTQECIAYKIGGKGVLKYTPSFDGERYEFDERYFL